MPRPIDTPELFFAHALAIEREAVERYAEFAEWFAERGEETLSGLCASLETLEREHLEGLLGATSRLDLPAVEDARYRWLDAGSPEAAARELFYRVTTAVQLLRIALDAERNARRFFAWIARTTRDPHVRRLARAMAREEAQHVRWVQDALEYRDATPDWERLIAEGAGPGAFTAA